MAGNPVAAAGRLKELMEKARAVPEAAAATSAVGFIVSINGQTAAPTATAPVPAVA